MRDTAGHSRPHFVPRLLAAVLGVVAIWLLVDAVVSATIAPGYSFPGHIMRALGCGALTVVLLVVLVRLENPPPGYYGLVPTAASPRFALVGAVSYLVPFAIAAAAVLGLGLAALEVPDGPWPVLGQLVVLLLLVLAFEAIPEELVFRGYLYRVLGERLPTWVVVVAQAALFTAWAFVIGAGTSGDRLLLFFAFSLLQGVLRAISGSVFTTIGFHAAFQLCTQFVVGGNWSAVVLRDDQQWFRDIATGLAPFVFAGVIVALLLGDRRLVGRRRRR